MGNSYTQDLCRGCSDSLPIAERGCYHPDYSCGDVYSAWEEGYIAGLEAAAKKVEARAGWYAEKACERRGATSPIAQEIAAALRIVSHEIRATKGDTQ